MPGESGERFSPKQMEEFEKQRKATKLTAKHRAICRLNPSETSEREELETRAGIDNELRELEVYKDFKVKGPKNNPDLIKGIIDGVKIVAKYDQKNRTLTLTRDGRKETNSAVAWAEYQKLAEKIAEYKRLKEEDEEYKREDKNNKDFGDVTEKILS